MDDKLEGEKEGGQLNKNLKIKFVPNLGLNSRLHFEAK